jgi:hypothetical protein
MSDKFEKIGAVIAVLIGLILAAGIAVAAFSIFDIFANSETKEYEIIAVVEEKKYTPSSEYTAYMPSPNGDGGVVPYFHYIPEEYSVTFKYENYTTTHKNYEFYSLYEKGAEVSAVLKVTTTKKGVVILYDITPK